MSQKYTHKTAKLKAVMANIGQVKSNQIITNSIDASTIKLNGQNITEVIEETAGGNGGGSTKVRPRDLVYRCELPSDRQWAIWSDDGDLLDMNFGEDIYLGGTDIEKGLFAGLAIKNFSIDLPNLTTAWKMFAFCPRLQTFKSDMSSLTDAHQMFTYDFKLKSFEADVSSLEDGSGMFTYCTKLQQFKGNLSSLKNGEDMFYGCNLNSKSVRNILTSIPTNTNNGTLTLFIQPSAISTANQILNSNIPTDEMAWQYLHYDVEYKGWTIQVYKFINPINLLGY